MKRSLSSRGRLLLALAVLTTTGAWPAAAEDGAGPDAAPDSRGQGTPKIGVVLKVENRVEGLRQGRSEPLQKDDSIELGQTLRTGRDSSLIVRFDHDGELSLAEHSQASIDPPQAPGHCPGKKVVSTVSLHQGIVHIIHDARSGPDQVEVVTASAVVCLLGTNVMVQADAAGVTRVWVLEGSARVSARESKRGRPLTLGKTFQTVVEKGKAPGLPFSVPGRHANSLVTLASLLNDPFGISPESPLLDGIDPSGTVSKH